MQFLVNGFIVVCVHVGEGLAVGRERFQPDSLILAGGGAFPRQRDLPRSFLEPSCRFFDMVRYRHGHSSLCRKSHGVLTNEYQSRVAIVHIVEQVECLAMSRVSLEEDRTAVYRANSPISDDR